MNEYDELIDMILDFLKQAVESGDYEYEDSRERLEADMAEYLEREWYMLAPGLLEKMGGWLDRQAAITEHEYGERMASEAMCSNVCAVVCEQRGRIAELQAQVYELTAEREQYRKLFGMAPDWAHEITMLESSIDEGMA